MCARIKIIKKQKKKLRYQFEALLVFTKSLINVLECRVVIL